jgi:CTP:molybdopterin cytidylyltransferase MocA
MTVAAVILSATPAGAIAPTEGQPRVRRLVDIAWSGGAVPIVVVAADPEGSVATALAGSPATLGDPAPPEAGPVGQIVRGIEIAADIVRETEAALVWPARMTWVDPESVTSLIEAHGADPAPILRPAYLGEVGWPAVLPLAHLAMFRDLARDRMPDDLIADLQAAGVPIRAVELGDPGVVFDAETARAELPPFEGPPEPAGGHVHEWGAAAAERSDDEPLEGPALAPYGQAVATDPDQPG